MILATSEFTTTALLLATFGLLMVSCVVFTRWAERTGVPLALLFLALGMLAGSEGIGGVAFDDHRFAFRVGTMALVLILFDGGLNTTVGSIRRSIRPAVGLATAGVALTAGLVALGGRALGLTWGEALLVGAVVSSTDAAVVFAVLRGGRIGLSPRVATTLELESGLNDPMAVLLTVVVTEAIVSQRAPGWGLALVVPVQLAVGLGAGVALGMGGRWLLRRIRVTAGGLFPVATLGLAFLSYGVATALQGSGFLAVYATAVTLGAGEIPYRSSLRKIHDAIAWLCQVGMFLMLGLLVFPSRLPDVAWQGLLLGLLLAFVARPLAVAACLAPFRYPWRETVYIGWVGLRGAVPIILATYPVLSGAPGAMRVFDIVFFVVVVSALTPGATVRWATRRLGLEVKQAPTPAAALEIASMRTLKGELESFYIDSTLAVCGAKIAQIHFPEGAAVALVVRGEELIAAKGTTTLEEGDHAYMFFRPEDRGYIELLFGRPQGGE